MRVMLAEPFLSVPEPFLSVPQASAIYNFDGRKKLKVDLNLKLIKLFTGYWLVCFSAEFARNP